MTEQSPHIVKDYHPDNHLPPSGKKFQLAMTYSALFNAYQIESITNTVWYKPGMWLSEDVVRQICNLSAWEVTMAQSHYFTSIVGAAKSIPIPLPI